MQQLDYRRFRVPVGQTSAAPGYEHVAGSDPNKPMIKKDLDRIYPLAGDFTVLYLGC